MRIVIAALAYYPDAPSGSARLAFDEAMHLVRLGHEVWMVARDPLGRRPEHEEVEKLHVLRYPPGHVRGSTPLRCRVHQLQTKRLLDRHLPGPADCVHGHTLLQYAGALAHCGRQVRSCFSVHSPAQLELLASATGAGFGAALAAYPRAAAIHVLERRCLRRTDRITAFSDYTRGLIRRMHGSVIADRVRVIHGWADLSHFRIVPDRAAARTRLGWPVDVPVFFTLRRLVPRMGLDRLIEALSLVNKAGRRCHLVIAGDGPLRGDLRRLAGDLGLESSVQFVGRVDDAALPMMYGAADAFVLPTRALECFGLIAVEALACGVPVLATPTGAIPEIINRIEPQWLARNTGAEAIGDLLARFLEDRLPRHSASDLRAHVQSRYALDDRVAELAGAALGTPADGS